MRKRFFTSETHVLPPVAVDMIKYYKLFDLLNRRGLKKKDLQQIISAPTIAKLSKGETVKTDIIDKICLFLDCQPGDIMETFKAIEITEKDGTKRTVKLKTSNADEDIRQYYLEEMQREREISYSRVRKEMEKNENS